MKIVINNCYGGYSLSKEAQDLYCQQKGINPGVWDSQWNFYDKFNPSQIDRNDEVLVNIVEQMGDKANGSYASLKIVEVPDDVRWTIQEYDGAEWVAEVHRTWA